MLPLKFSEEALVLRAMGPSPISTGPQVVNTALCSMHSTLLNLTTRAADCLY